MSKLSETDIAAMKLRLGLGEICPDLAGLRAFYRAWCLNVPFDNLRKMNAMFRDPDAPLPDLAADSFASAWLDHGVGGTCWPHGEALYGALKALGFDARRATGSMYDLGEPNHATTLVRLDEGSTWLIDNALHTMEPLRIDSEAPTFLNHPLHYAEAEIDGDTVFIHGTHPPMPHIFFRLLDRDVSEAEYQERWVSARTLGPFISHVHIRRNSADQVRTLRGSMLFTLGAGGMQVEPLDADGVRRHLRETFGVSPEFVDAWAASGALESSMTPSAPPPELPVRVPPSKRV